MIDYREKLIQLLMDDLLSGSLIEALAALARYGNKGYNNYEISELESDIADAYEDDITNFFGDESWMNQEGSIKAWVLRH